MYAKKAKCTRMFPAQLVAIATNWKTIKCFSIGVWLKTLRDTHTMELCNHLKECSQSCMLKLKKTIITLRYIKLKSNVHIKCWHLFFLEGQTKY